MIDDEIAEITEGREVPESSPIRGTIEELEAIIYMAAKYDKKLLAAYALIGWVLFRYDQFQLGSIINIGTILDLTVLIREIEVRDIGYQPFEDEDLSEEHIGFINRAMDALVLALKDLRRGRYAQVGSDPTLMENRRNASIIYLDLQYWMQHIGFETKRVASVTTQPDMETREPGIVQRFKNTLLSILQKQVGPIEVQDDDRVYRYIDRMEELETTAVLLAGDPESVDRVIAKIKDRSKI